MVEWNSSDSRNRRSWVHRERGAELALLERIGGGRQAGVPLPRRKRGASPEAEKQRRGRLGRSLDMSRMGADRLFPPARGVPHVAACGAARRLHWSVPEDRKDRAWKRRAGQGPVDRAGKGRGAEEYRHPEASALFRPDVGTQAQFRKKKEPATYRYDSSLSPALDWDGRNPVREQAEAKIAALQERIARLAAVVDAGSGEGIPERDLAGVREELAAAREDAAALKALSTPFLDWAGKAERLSFDVPTLPLFVHERLSTAAILETLKGHANDRQADMFDLFG